MWVSGKEGCKANLLSFFSNHPKAICSLSLPFVGLRVSLGSSNSVAFFLCSVLMSKAPRRPQFGCAGEWVRYLLKPAFLGSVPFLLLGTPQMIKLTGKLTSFPFFFLQALLNVFPWPLPGQEPPAKRLWFSFFTPLVWKLTWVWEGVLEFHITFLLQSQTRISARQYFSAFQKWFPPPTHPFKELF